MGATVSRARRRLGAPQAGERSVAAAALLFATAAAAEGGPAAALPYDSSTPLRRLLDQLASLGVSRAHLITRPEFVSALAPLLDGVELETRLRVCADPSEDLVAVAELARSEPDGIVLLHGEIVTQREALASLIADPRVGTGILARTDLPGNIHFPTRSVRGRVLSAGTPFHWVERPNGLFIGILRVDAAALPALTAVAERLAALLEAPPAPWLEELARKARTVGDPPPEDVPALLLMAIVRDGTPVRVRYLRSLFWARPLSLEASRRAARQILDYDEERVRLASAVKSADGFFTTFFVSPYSRYIARWAARLGLTPNQVTLSSLCVGMLAAASFGTGERSGLVAGAILLQVAFALDCVDGQLARYARTFTSFGAWLDSVFDRLKEWLVFAGLAIGSTRGFGVDVWALAAAALTLQTARHMLDFMYWGTEDEGMERVPQAPLEQPGDTAGAPPADVSALAPPDVEDGGPSPAPRSATGVLSATLRFSRALERPPALRWAKRIVVFPIGERFAAISLAAALGTPRTVFVVLLVWGVVAAVYSLSSRLIRSVLA